MSGVTPRPSADLLTSTDVNSRPLALSPLHKVINDRFASSSFGRHASAHIDSPSASPAPYRMKKSPSTLKSATAERCPIFVLNLIAPPSMVDVTLEPEKRVVEFQVSVGRERAGGPLR